MAEMGKCVASKSCDGLLDCTVGRVMLILYRACREDGVTISTLLRFSV